MSQASAVAQVQTQVQTQVPMQMQSVEVEECPICLEVIEGFKNRVTTECGHTFHCKCLMTNAAHNGFGCPFCRTEMADEVADSESEDNDDRYDDDSEDGDDASRASDYDSEQDDLEGELEYIENEIKRMKVDHVLRGFRWLFQPLNDDDVISVAEEEDLEAEEEDLEAEEEEVISVAE